MLKSLSTLSFKVVTTITAAIALPLLSINTMAWVQNSTKINQSHAIAMHGDIKYKAGFEHFEYTNPLAPKTGRIKLASQGTFDSLNPFIAKGTSADYLFLLYDTLTTSSLDEPFTQYGLIAQTIIWPEDRSFVEYKLNPHAKFSDGTTVTSKDVKFSFELLTQKASPAYKTQYAGVSSVTIIDKHRVRFDFKNTENTELVLVVGQLPILPSHAINPDEFDKSSLTIPIGSGPYILSKVNTGKRTTFTLNSDYWAKNLNVNKGRYNFSRIDVDYYRDSTVMLEALKSNEYDYRYENVSKLWATAYTGNALKSGQLIKENIPHQNPTGMQAFVLNQRNPLFSDVRVRQALNLAFDFEWANQQLFYGAYKRAYSYFSNSELAATGLPSAQELKLLTPLKSHLPETVFTRPFILEKTTGNGRPRAQLKKAQTLLNEAGWQVKNNQLTSSDGKQFVIEFLVFDPSWERIVNPFIKNLARLGIQASIKKVEISQYINLLRSFNYDVITSSFGQSLSPGIEQKQYWHSSTADMPASRNYIGIKNHAVDQLIEHLIRAKNRDELVTATKALDRALLHNWYVIPQWYIDSHRIAYWNKFSRPKISAPFDSRYMGSLFTWWLDENKNQMLNQAK